MNYELIYPGDFASGEQLWPALDGYLLLRDELLYR